MVSPLETKVRECTMWWKKIKKERKQARKKVFKEKYDNKNTGLPMVILHKMWMGL